MRTFDNSSCPHSSTGKDPTIPSLCYLHFITFYDNAHLLFPHVVSKSKQHLSLISSAHEHKHKLYGTKIRLNIYFFCSVLCKGAAKHVTAKGMASRGACVNCGPNFALSNHMYHYLYIVRYQIRVVFHVLDYLRLLCSSTLLGFFVFY